MPKYEVSWQVFGTIVVEADNEDEADEIAGDYIGDEIGLEWDGLDIGDIDPAADWQTPVN